MPIIVETTENTQAIATQIERIFEDLPDADKWLSIIQGEIQPPYRVYTGEFNSRITATGIIEIIDANTSKLLHVAVHKANRGRDIAQRVISEIIRQEHNLGIQKMQTEASLSSGEFNALAKSCGFTKDKSDPSILVLSLPQS